MFINKGRVTKEEGLRFYQKDIVMFEYILTGDAIIELNAEYLLPGLGIVLQDMHDSALLYLCRIGARDASIVRKRLARQETLARSAIQEKAPGKVELMLSKSGDWLELFADGSSIGRAMAPDRLDRYYFGVYSNRDNAIHEVDVHGSGPARWRTGVKNVDGGFISFYRNGLELQDCRQDAEIEQDGIRLERGTYYLDYEKTGDLTPYVFHMEDPRIDDEEKNILQENNKIVLQERTPVNVKFKGTDGTLEEIAIKSTAADSFVPTQSTPAIVSGSEIVFDLSLIESINWTGKIKEPPIPGEEHGVVSTEHTNLEIDDIGIDVGKEYRFELNMIEGSPIVVASDPEQEDSSVFIFADGRAISALKNLDFEEKSESELYLIPEGGDKELITSYPPDEPEPDHADKIYYLVESGEDKLRQIPATSVKEIILGEDKKLHVFYNLNAEIYDIHVEYYDSRAFDVLGQQTSVHQVPDVARGPVVVVDDYNAPLELSSSYRYYSKKDETTGKEVVFYRFTNWEREIFEPSFRLNLEKSPTEHPGTILVYGIPHGAETNEDRILEVTGEGYNDIEPYSKSYELLDREDFSYNSYYGYIEIHGGRYLDFQKILVDYLKDRSYCVNHKKELGIYEIDISSTEGASNVIYDQAAGGGMLTGIRPDQSKYVVLSNDRREAD